MLAFNRDQSAGEPSIAAERPAQLFHPGVGAAGNNRHAHSEILRCAAADEGPPRIQLQASAVHTPDAAPFAPVMLKSTKLPAAIVTLPASVHATPVDAEQASAVSDMFPGAPVRSVTVIGFGCCENTCSEVAVHPLGIHVIAGAASVALELELFTE